VPTYTEDDTVLNPLVSNLHYLPDANTVKPITIIPLPVVLILLNVATTLVHTPPKTSNNLQHPPKCNTCGQHHPTYSYKCRNRPEPTPENPGLDISVLQNLKHATHPYFLLHKLPYISFSLSSPPLCKICIHSKNPTS